MVQYENKQLDRRKIKSILFSIKADNNFPAMDFKIFPQCFCYSFNQLHILGHYLGVKVSGRKYVKLVLFIIIWTYN